MRCETYDCTELHLVCVVFIQVYKTGKVTFVGNILKVIYNKDFLCALQIHTAGQL